MSSEQWQTYKVGQLCESVSITHKFDKDRLVFLNTGDIERGNFLHRDYSNVIGMPGQAKKSIKRNDILFSEIRPANGRYAFVDFDAEDYVVSTKLMVIRAGEQILPRYLYHFLTHRNITDWLQHLAESRSGTFPQITFTQVDDLDILLPPLSIQKVIIEFVDALDEKIELNGQMNATLEAMAQAIFEEWFVRYNYPGASGDLVESALGLIPAGWRVGTLGEIVINYDNKRVPLSSRERENRKGKYPYYGAASIVDYIDGYLFDGVYLLMGEDGTVITNDEKPILQYVQGKFWVNNHAHVLQGNRGFSTEFVYLFLANTNIKHIVTGAVQPKINQGNMNNLTVIIPDTDIFQQFQRIVKPIFEHVLDIRQQSATLAQIRDTLLPKLMRGEIAV